MLAAARAAFGKKGYGQTSVDEIAAAARVTKGAVYHHFAGKEALFRAVWSEVEAEALARTAETAGAKESPIDQIVAGVDAYLAVALDPEVRQITLIDGPTVLGLEPDGPADQHPSHLAMRSFIATAIGRGQIVDLDPGMLAHLVGGLALQGGLLIARSGDPEAVRARSGAGDRGDAPRSDASSQEALTRGPADEPGLRLDNSHTKSMFCTHGISNARNPARDSVAWQSSGHGPTLVFFAGALANHDLWRDVVAALEDQYRCITIDLPLGAHPWPMSPGADRSATSLAGLMLDCLELLEVEDATVVANDTAGGLLLLSLDTDHPALGRIGRLVLTNCDNYDQFPPDALKKAAAVVSPASPTRSSTDAVSVALVVPPAQRHRDRHRARTGPRTRTVVHGADATRSTGGR